VSGRVLDEAGKPLAGVKLLLWQGKAKPRDAGETGKDGRFRLVLARTNRRRN